MCCLFARVSGWILSKEIIVKIGKFIHTEHRFTPVAVLGVGRGGLRGPCTPPHAL